MWDRAWAGAFRRDRENRHPVCRKAGRGARQPQVEGLECRQLLAASLAPLADVTVPSQEGYQVILDGSASHSTTQNFSASSTNPDIKVSVATGPYWTLDLSHQPATGVQDVTINHGKVTFQLFQDLTPTTTALFESFTNSGYYTGKTIHRINTKFSGTGGPADTVIQGGSPNGDGTGSSGLPGTPYSLELNQQLAFTQYGSLAVANSGGNNTNDVQFFWDTGPQTSLNYKYTIFGNLVAGKDTTNLLSQVATTTNPGLGEQSKPISPVIINSATLSNTNPNGILHIDATGASPGEAANVTVEVVDPTTNTSTMRTFHVTIAANTTPPPSTFTFTPLASPVTQVISSNTPGATGIQLKVTNNNTNASPALTTTYALVSQPAHGTLSNFNATTGTVTYTPNPGYFGTDAFSYQGILNGGTVTNLKGNVAPVLINITPQAPQNTNAVRVIGTVLVVTPPPSPLHGPTNQILVTETQNPQSPANQKLNVTINGVTDLTQPLASSIDRIVVYGSKSGNTIKIDPSVDPTINVTLDGGHGGKNVLQASRGPTREHGWFGQNTLLASTTTNQLVGRAGHVRFFATKATNEIFAGQPHPGYHDFHKYKNKSSVALTPPGGTFYKLVNNKLVPVPTPPAVHGMLLQQTANSSANGTKPVTINSANTGPNATATTTATGAPAGPSVTG
jgi:cyclophilin family peptidyl-prolyl cis-trans isomerase